MKNISPAVSPIRDRGRLVLEELNAVDEILENMGSEGTERMAVVDFARDENVESDADEEDS